MVSQKWPECDQIHRDQVLTLWRRRRAASGRAATEAPTIEPPMSFVASRGELKRLLQRHQKCVLKN